MISTQEVMTLKGFVQAIPRSTAEDGARVALVTTSGEEYPVLHKGAGVDLVDHISADVEVTASLVEMPEIEGGKALRVRKYQVLDGYEDPWYDDEEA